MDGEHHPDWLAVMINEGDDAATLITPSLAREFLARPGKRGDVSELAVIAGEIPCSAVQQAPKAVAAEGRRAHGRARRSRR